MTKNGNHSETVNDKNNTSSSSKNTVPTCGDGCVFAVKQKIVSGNNNSRILVKYRCLLGHGRGNFVKSTDYCSWYCTDDEYFKDLRNLIKIYGKYDINEYYHASSPLLGDDDDENEG